MKNPDILVDVETHDDAGVYRLNDETALIFTTDFFPPVCSDPYTFGEIAAANSLSDVYAMGGKPLLTLNLTMFPSDKIPLDVLSAIISGAQSKVNESGAFTMGGHTINDYPPKFGLAVVGTTHPDKLVTNAGAKAGQKLILTKPLGNGIILSGKKMDMVTSENYEAALDKMKLLNKTGMELMARYHVRGATDITGFGLLGHLMKLCQASDVSVQIDSASLPALPGVFELLESGCIPGVAFRNWDFVRQECLIASGCSSAHKMLACDAQTSGGLLIAVDADFADQLLADLKASGQHPYAAIIGEVIPSRNKRIYML